MGTGRHCTKKSINDPTYNFQWSGVSYAPHCGCTCKKCGKKVHLEAGEHYCPYCDDYVPVIIDCRYVSKKRGA